MVIKGNFKLASNHIKEKLQDPKISDYDRIRLDLLDSKILNLKGLYFQVVENTIKIKEKIKKNEFIFLLVDCYFIEFNAQVRLYNEEQCNELLIGMEATLEKIQKENPEIAKNYLSKYTQKQAMFERYFGILDNAEKLYFSAISQRSKNKVDYNYADGEAWNHLGIIYDQKGDFDSSIDAYKKSLIIYEYFQDEFFSIGITTNMGLVYWQQGKLKQAISINAKGLEMAYRINNSRTLTPLLINNGLINIDLGNLEDALLNFEESLSNAMSIGHQKGILLSYMNSGIIYDMKSQFDIALDNYLKCVDIAEKLNDNFESIRLFNNIAKTYRNKGDFKNAIIFLERALERHNLVNNEILLSKTLFELIITSLKDLQFTQSKIHLEEFHKLSLQTDYKSIKTLYKLTNALSLKIESGLLNRARALQLFNEVLLENELTYEVALTAIISSCEILVTEVSATRNEMDLQQIDFLITKMEGLSNNNPSIKVQIDILLLKSRISFMFDEIDEAFELLKKGKKLSIENNLDYLQKIVENEQMYLEDMVTRMTEIGESATIKLKLDQKRNIDYIEFLRRNFKGLSL